jgi:hypothetical protein
MPRSIYIFLIPETWRKRPLALPRIGVLHINPPRRSGGHVCTLSAACDSIKCVYALRNTLPRVSFFHIQILISYLNFDTDSNFVGQY